jgi:acetate kinase
MGTRPGDLDPGLILYLLREPGATTDSVEQMLNHDAGLKALAGTSDMHRLRDQAANPPANLQTSLALNIFTASVRRTIGGFAALYGVDALVFTGGIGEHDALSRSAIANGVWGNQTSIDPAANQSGQAGLRRVSSPGSAIEIYIVPAEEDLMIARHVARMIEQ